VLLVRGGAVSLVDVILGLAVLRSCFNKSVLLALPLRGRYGVWTSTV